jgi:hypothetical protein
MTIIWIFRQIRIHIYLSSFYKELCPVSSGFMVYSPYMYIQESYSSHTIIIQVRTKSTLDTFHTV